MGRLVEDEALMERAVDYALAFYKASAEEALAVSCPDAYLRLRMLARNPRLVLSFECEYVDEVYDIQHVENEGACLCVTLIYCDDPETCRDYLPVARVYFSQEDMEEHRAAIDWFPENQEYLESSLS